MNLRLLLPLGLLLAHALPAQQPPAAEHARLFELADRDHDGRLSSEELPERARPHFGRLDTDRNGYVSRAEHAAALERLRRPGAVQPGRRPALPEGVEARLDLPYAGTDNPRQKLDIYLPRERAAGKPLPVIVFVHGGGWRAGDKSRGALNIVDLVASGDYAGVSVGYRLTDEAIWPAQIHDCKAAIRWLKAHAAEWGLDPARIGVWGSSAGGHLVSLLGTSADVPELEGSLGAHPEQNSRVACVVNYFGPENFLTLVRQPSTIDRSQGRDYPEALLLGGPVAEREAAARQASPVTHVSADDAPFLTVHGTRDPVVPYAQAGEIHAALQKAGVPSLLQAMSGAGHGGFRSPELDRRVRQFLDRHLRGVDTAIDTAPIAGGAN